MKKYLVLILIALFTIIVVGCSSDSQSQQDSNDSNNTENGTNNEDTGSSDEQITIQFMRPGDVGTVRGIFEPMLDEFMKENPNINVEIVDMGWGEYDQRLSTMIATQSNPDVQLVSQGYLFTHIGNGAYLPLDDFIDDELKNQVFENLWEASMLGNEIYQVPATPGGDVLWYNAQLFEQAGLDPNRPPETWEELIEYSIKIKENTGVPGLGLAGKSFTDIWSTFATLYQSIADKPLLDEETQTFNFDSPEGVKALQMLHDIVYEYQIVQDNIDQYTRGDLRTHFRDQQVAMLLDGPFILSVLRESENVDNPDETFVRSATSPKADKGSHPFFGADGWAIASNTKHPEEAWKLLRFLVSKENQYIHGTQYGVAPPQKDVAEMEGYQTEYWKHATQSIEEGYSRMKSEHFIAIDQILVEMVQKVLLDVASPEQAIEEAVQELEALTGN